MEKQFKRFSLWGMLYLCITLTACSDNEEEFHSYLVADSKSESLFANGINVDAGDILQSVSRLKKQISSPTHFEYINKFISILAQYAEKEELIDIGKIDSINNPEMDYIIKMNSKCKNFSA